MAFGTMVLTVLRIIHIFGAVAWIGGGIYQISVTLPTAKEAGPDGAKFMQWIGRSGRLTRLFTVASIATIVAGVVLFFPISGNFNGGWLGSGTGIVLSIGGVIGLAAFFHGIFGAGAVARRMGTLAQAMASRQGPPAPEQIQQAQTLGASMSRHAMISVVLGSLALLFMAAAQTF